MTPAVTVIVPTTGRDTLGRTLDSLTGDGVEVIVVADERERPLPHVRDMVWQHGPRFRHLRHASDHMDWGGSARNAALPLARGQYVAFVDDDDAWASNAAETLLDAISGHPGEPLVFKMRYSDDGRLLWSTPSVQPGNIGTPMFVLPRAMALRARWDETVYDHDWRYLRDCLGGAEPVWREDVLAEIRP